MLCNICNQGMREVDFLNSGNSKFITFQCTKCMNRVVRCSGIRGLSTI